MEAIDKLIFKWQQRGINQRGIAEEFSKCELYVTCEPCIMCAAALSILGQFVFANNNHIYQTKHVFISLSF